MGAKKIFEGLDEALEYAGNSALVFELENRDFDFAAHVGIDPNDEKEQRFREVKDKLTWEQWNWLLSIVDKMKHTECVVVPKKYDKL